MNATASKPKPAIKDCPHAASHCITLTTSKGTARMCKHCFRKNQGTGDKDRVGGDASS